MKACNILVSEEEGEGWRFQLLDLEDVRLGHEGGGERDCSRIFFSSIPPSQEGITHTDRMRFYKEYCRLHPFVQDKKGFLSKLIQRARRGVLFMSLLKEW